MGTGGCVLLRRTNKPNIVRYVAHSGYPRGFGKKLAALLCAGNMLDLFEFLLLETRGECPKDIPDSCTYVVDLDAETVQVYEEENEEPHELSYGEFMNWCT